MLSGYIERLRDGRPDPVLSSHNSGNEVETSVLAIAVPVAHAMARLKR